MALWEGSEECEACRRKLQMACGLVVAMVTVTVMVVVGEGAADVTLSWAEAGTGHWRAERAR